MTFLGRNLRDYWKIKGKQKKNEKRKTLEVKIG